ncbi:MarR family transcriptional regulator [Azospirillaceae bacterium]
MPPKKNPLKLNSLQLKTLALLQAFARLPGYAIEAEEPGAVRFPKLPHPHGDHFHVGGALALTRDATGLHNPSVLLALSRKGLIHVDAAHEVILTANGGAYDCGLDQPLLHHGDH